MWHGSILHIYSFMYGHWNRVKIVKDWIWQSPLSHRWIKFLKCHMHNSPTGEIREVNGGKRDKPLRNNSVASNLLPLTSTSTNPLVEFSMLCYANRTDYWHNIKGRCIIASLMAPDEQLFRNSWLPTKLIAPDMLPTQLYFSSISQAASTGATVVQANIQSPRNCSAICFFNVSAR